MIKKITKIFLTGLYTGNLKFMPGTFGTFLAIPIFILISNNNLIFNLIFISILFIVSLIILNYAYDSHIYTNADDKSIVIDEIVGYLFFMIFFEYTFYNVVLGFLLFRFFDIFKPYPIYIIDKNFKNSFGIMLDDIIAGLYSGLTLYFLNYLL